jgi:hypothetical protein
MNDRPEMRDGSPILSPRWGRASYNFALKVGDGKTFRSCRHYAARVGITRRENSTAGRRRLGRISKGEMRICGACWCSATAVSRPNQVGNRALQGNDRARKIDGEPVAGRVEDPPAMARDQPVHHREAGLDPGKRAGLVEPISRL